jgi:hypothetical protein
MPHDGNDDLTLVAILEVKDGLAHSRNGGSWWPVEAYLSSTHPDNFDAIGDLGGDDLAVVPFWPAADFGFSVAEAFLSADGTRLVLSIETTLALDEYVVLVEDGA